jgi:hypothetical protein
MSPLLIYLIRCVVMALVMAVFQEIVEGMGNVPWESFRTAEYTLEAIIKGTPYMDATYP